MKTRPSIFFLLVPLAGAIGAEEELTSEQLKFFEAKIRPALVESCYKCHSADEKIKGGLRVDNRAAMRAGGDSGPAVVPGDLEESLLWTAINWADEDYEMPPKKKLPAAVIADFKKWIEMGAPDPRVAEKLEVRTEIDLEEGRKFWSFQKPVKSDPPAVKQAGWAAAEADRFVLAKLEENGLSPAAEASPETLLRRLYFDLVGLPPSLEEVKAYGKAWRADPEKAYREKVDELLASEHFGERWGRHWLDVARYAESTGKEVNMTYPHAWRYRDYVIDSFNKDKPYDRFVKEQIAGDLLKIKSDEEWQENLVATGFLALGVKSLNERDPRQFAMDLADEQIDAMSQAVLGLTVSCARCHDHKSDPIPTADYYSLSGIFQSTKAHFGTVNVIVSRRATKLLELPIPDSDPVTTLPPRQLEAMRSRLADAQQQLSELTAGAGRRGPGGAPPENLQQILRLRSTITQTQARIRNYNDDGSAKSFAMGVQDYDRPVEPVVLVRGELDKPAQKVERGFLQVLDHAGSSAQLPRNGSGRLELAEWLTMEDNPLTARVMVNRIWHHLFGQGLVTSPNNFGATGKAPSHPELLDYLAVHFMEEGWSVKGLIRELVTSRTYRMSTQFDLASYTKDPDNALLWRASPRGLDAESLRDAMLVASGELDRSRPKASPVAQVGDVAVGRRFGADQINRPATYRSVYLPQLRDALPESLALFDPSDPNMVTGARETSNVPGQALYMMNNAFVIEQSMAMARRLVNEAESPKERIGLAFMLAYGRVASTAEIQGAVNFLQNFLFTVEKQGKDREQAGFLALTTFCQGLLASSEFRFLN